MSYCRLGDPFSNRYVRLGSTRRPSGGVSYIDKVLGIQPADLLAYWPLNETSGMNANNVEGTAARDGTYTGVTLNSIIGPDGANGAPFCDGANDYVDVFSTSLRDVFDGDEGTYAWWQKVFNAGVWTDATVRVPSILGTDASNRLLLQKRSQVNSMRLRHDAGGANKGVNPSSSETGWEHFAITWSLLADEVKIYQDGSQFGATQTGLNAWVGVLTIGNCFIGASSAVPAQVFHGYLAHVNTWSIPLPPTEILSLATV